MPRISLLALMALLALPVSAHAAEGFVGVTERGSVVRFTSETPLSLTTPKRPTGMAPGERIVALGQRPARRRRGRLERAARTRSIP